jgi:hypothetical protein
MSTATLHSHDTRTVPAGGTIPRRGRRAVVSIPNIELTAGWADAWLGHELSMRAAGLTEWTIRNRRSSFHSVAKHAISGGLADPSMVSRPWMMSYLAGEIKNRRGLGAGQHYQNLLSFWKWYCAEYEQPTNPMERIPRPRGSSPPPPVLDPGQLTAILAACNGRGWLSVRDKAIISMPMESGMRRDEVAVDAERDLDVAVAQPLGHVGDGAPGGQGHRGEQVAQLVGVVAGQPGGLRGGLEPLVELAGGDAEQVTVARAVHDGPHVGRARDVTELAWPPRLEWAAGTIRQLLPGHPEVAVHEVALAQGQGLTRPDPVASHDPDDRPDRLGPRRVNSQACRVSTCHQRSSRLRVATARSSRPAMAATSSA